MAQLLDIDILQRIFSGNVSTKDAVIALVDRQSGRILTPEGELLDYKRELNIELPGAIAELRETYWVFLTRTVDCFWLASQMMEWLSGTRR